MANGSIGEVDITIGADAAPFQRQLEKAADNAATIAAKAGTTVQSKLDTTLAAITAKSSGMITSVGNSMKSVGEKIKSGISVATDPSAWVSGISKAANSMKDVLMSKLGDLGSAAKEKMKAIGSALGGALQGTATAGVALAVGALTVAFTSGFNRLSAIDSAAAKLRGLGNDADQVAGIMKNATASVRGTAFGLGDAATTAAGAVAAGIEPGQRLEGVLKTVANVAASTNRGMQETGAIFNKVAAGGKATTESIAQIADAGLPIWQALGVELGVTTGEVQKLASESAISFDIFEKAAKAAAGTVAEEMGKTVPGAFSNLKASLGRVGANLLGGVYDKIAPLFQSITKAMGPLEEVAKRIGSAIGDKLGPALDKITGMFNKLGSGEASSSLSSMLAILGPLGGAFMALGAGGLGGMTKLLGPFASLLGPLPGMLGALGGPLGIAAAAIGGFMLTGGDAGKMGSAFVGMIDGIVAAVPGVVMGFATVVPEVLNSLLAALPSLLGAGVSMLNAIIDGIVTSLPWLISATLLLVQGLLDGIVTNLPAIIAGGVMLVNSLVNGLIQMLPALVDGGALLIFGLLDAVLASLPLIISAGITLVTSLAYGLLDALPVLLETALPLLLGLVEQITANLPVIIESGISILLGLVDGLLSVLPQLISAALTVIVQLAVGLLNNMPQIIDAGIQLIVGLIAGLVQAIPRIVAAIPAIISAIKNTFTETDWGGLGRDLIAGVARGITGSAGAIVSAVKNAAKSALDGAKNFLGIQSPSKVFRDQIGKQIPAGLAGGVELATDLAVEATKKMTRKVSASSQVELGFSNSAALGVGISGRTGVSSLGKLTSSSISLPSPQASSYSGFPSQVVLKADDGTYLGVFRTVADERVNSALAPVGRGALADRLGRMQ